jgi:hypothetical protein
MLSLIEQCISTKIPTKRRNELILFNIFLLTNMPPKRISKKTIPAKKLDMINPFAKGADEIMKKRAEKKT